MILRKSLIMKKILFITNRDVLTTCGAFRLIGNRAEALYQLYNVVTDFCVIQKDERLSSPKRDSINAGGVMTVVTYNKFNVLSSICKLHREVYRMIKENQYRAIVISEVSLPLNLKKIKKLSGLPIYFDGHGSSEDIYECARKRGTIPFVLRYCAYLLDIKLLKRYFKIADGCFVVSSGMKDYYQKKVGLPDNFTYLRVPCATSSVLSDNEYINYRKEYQKHFNLEDDTISFVYSGGVESWQCVQETIDLFRSISSQLDIKSKLFVFSYEVDKAKEMVGNDNRIVVDSFSAKELKKALCAMDFAFMIRKDTVTNNVAFPNKFLEYTNARLNIITTPYVYDIAEQIKQFKLGYIYDFEDDFSGLVNYVEENKDSRLPSSVVNEVLTKNSFEERLKDFIQVLS